MSDPALNPLNWKRKHQAAWAASIVAGGFAGLICAWLISPFSHLWTADTGTMFWAWLHYPRDWLPWVIGGAIAAGLAYYSGDLLTGAD